MFYAILLIYISFKQHLSCNDSDGLCSKERRADNGADRDGEEWAITYVGEHQLEVLLLMQDGTELYQFSTLQEFR